MLIHISSLRDPVVTGFVCLNKYRFSWNQTFKELADCLFWFIQMYMIVLKRIKLEGIIYQKVFKNYNIINIKNFYDQPIYKLTTGQGKNYTTGCLLDYDCTKAIAELEGTK